MLMNLHMLLNFMHSVFLFLLIHQFWEMPFAEQKVILRQWAEKSVGYKSEYKKHLSSLVWSHSCSCFEQETSWRRPFQLQLLADSMMSNRHQDTEQTLKSAWDIHRKSMPANNSLKPQLLSIFFSTLRSFVISYNICIFRTMVEFRNFLIFKQLPSTLSPKI